MINHDLYALIRKVEGWPGKPVRGRAHVAIGGDGRALKDGAATAWLAGRLPGVRRHIYELRLDEPVQVWDAQETIRPFLTNEATDLRFRLEVTANDTNAAKIVEELHHDTESPAERLLAHVRSILESLIQEEVSTTGVQRIGNRILRDRLQWQNRIAGLLKVRTGLAASIVFEGTPQSEIVEITIDGLPVSPKDAPQASIALSFHVTLEPGATTPLDPLPPMEDARRRMVMRLVEEAVRREVTLYALWYDPGRSGDILLHRLSEALGQTGYRCTRFSIQPLRPPVDASQQVDVSLPWSGFRGREVTFHLDAILRLREDGAGRYHAAGRPGRKEWLRENGGAALRSAMHGRDFYDLTSAEQVAVGDRVRAMLVQAAQAIGHDIDPVAPEVRLAEKRWLTTQVLSFERGLYPTKNAAVEAEFSASLEIRFRRIRPLIDYIDYRTEGPPTLPDYNKAIDQAIRDLVRETLLIAMKTIESTDYYADWEQWDLPPDAFATPVRETRNYVRNKLVHAVRQVLTNRLEAEEVHLHLNRIDSDLTRIEEYLIALGPLDVEGVVQPTNSRKRSEAVPFALRVRVGNIDQRVAAAVKRRGADHLRKEDIRQSILGAAQEFLIRRSVKELRDLDVGVLAAQRSPAMKTRLQEHLSRHMVDSYGFDVRLEIAATGLSLAERNELDTGSIRDEQVGIALESTRDALRRQQTRSRAEAEHADRRMAKLAEAIENNPRRTQDDDERYLRDLRDLDEARRSADHAELRLEEGLRRGLTGTKPRDATAGTEGEDGDAPPGEDRAPNGPTAEF